MQATMQLSGTDEAANLAIAVNRRCMKTDLSSHSLGYSLMGYGTVGTMMPCRPESYL